MILGRKCYILQSEGGLHYKFSVNRYRLVEEGVDDWQRRARRDRGPAPITLGELLLQGSGICVLAVVLMHSHYAVLLHALGLRACILVSSMPLIENV